MDYKNTSTRTKGIVTLLALLLGLFVFAGCTNEGTRDATRSDTSGQQQIQILEQQRRQMERLHQDIQRQQQMQQQIRAFEQQRRQMERLHQDIQRQQQMQQASQPYHPPVVPHNTQPYIPPQLPRIP